MNKKIGVLVGSLRKGSFNRMTAEQVVELLPEGYEAEFLEIGQLPFYNEDIDAGDSPAEYVEFREKLEKYDAFLFATPEYNRSTPAVLKNALDVGSRPYGASKWDGKPAGVISVSPGAIGGFGANHHLRQSLVFLNMPVVQQPEVYLSNVMALIDDEGKLLSATIEFLQMFVDAFVDLVERY